MKLRSSAISYLMVAGVMALLLVLSFHVRVGATADSVALLKTTGMTCSSCADGIVSALQKVAGVVATEVDVAGGWVVVGYSTGTVKPELLAGTVSRAGYASSVTRVMTPAEYRQLSGKDIGRTAASADGCCGMGKCGMKQQKKTAEGGI